MARVKDLSIDEVPAGARADYARFAEQFGYFSNLIPVYAHSPEGLKHIFGLSAEMRDADVLPQRLVEIATVAVSRVNECPYCVAHHSARLVDHGLDVETVENILEPEVPGLDEVELLVRDYARLVTERPWGIRDKVFEDLRRHFSESQIVALTIRIALTGLFNKVNMALEIEMEDGFTEELTRTGISEANLPQPG